jgi:hypothetical protein
MFCEAKCRGGADHRRALVSREAAASGGQRRRLWPSIRLAGALTMRQYGH